MRIKTAQAIYVVSSALLLALGQAASALDRIGSNPQAPAVISGVVDVGTAKLHYEEAGKGDALVMIHGGNLAKEMWDGQFEEFAKSYRVVRYDARNHGRSRSEKATFAHFEDLNALFEELHIAKAVVMGLSMGGYVAVEFALRYPDKVSGLILVAPGLSGFKFHGPELEAFGEKYTAAVEAGDSEKMIESFMEAWTYGPKRKAEDLPQALRDKVRGMMRLTLMTRNKEAIEARLSPLASGRLGEIKVPTLAIVGDLDQPNILEIVDVLAKGIPDFRKVIIPGVAHLVNLERPAEFNAAVREFLEKVT